jgi:hypothetical protein
VVLVLYDPLREIYILWISRLDTSGHAVDLNRQCQRDASIGSSRCSFGCCGSRYGSITYKGVAGLKRPTLKQVLDSLADGLRAKPLRHTREHLDHCESSEKEKEATTSLQRTSGQAALTPTLTRCPNKREIRSSAQHTCRNRDG